MKLILDWVHGDGVMYVVVNMIESIIFELVNINVLRRGFAMHEVARIDVIPRVRKKVPKVSEGIDLGFRCPACGGWLWTAVIGVYNRWVCTACLGTARIENGVMELMPTDGIPRGPDDDKVEAMRKMMPEMSEMEGQRKFCQWLHGNAPNRTLRKRTK